MRKIIYTFAGVSLNLLNPFSYGKDYLDALNDLTNLLSENDKQYLKHDVTEIGFLVFDDRTKLIEVVNRWAALNIATKANQVKEEYKSIFFHTLESFMVEYYKLPNNFEKQLQRIRDVSIKKLI